MSYDFRLEVIVKDPVFQCLLIVFWASLYDCVICFLAVPVSDLLVHPGKCL